MSKRPCRGKQSHADAEAIVLFLEAQPDFQTTLPNMQIAARMGWLRHGGTVDKGRFRAAMNHLKDSIAADGKPCTGYVVHYRDSGPARALSLIADGVNVAVLQLEQHRGWLRIDKQRRTENRRHIASLEADRSVLMATMPGNKWAQDGYDILTRMVMDLDTDGYIRESTLIEYEVWAAVRV